MRMKRERYCQRLSLPFLAQGHLAAIIDTPLRNFENRNYF
jgi:hypothetical protein